MTKRILLSSIAGLAAAGLAAAQTPSTAPSQPVPTQPAPAQTLPTQPAPAQPLPGQPPTGTVPATPRSERQEAVPGQPAGQAYRAKQVLGARISLAGGTSVGVVDDIVVSDAGTVEYLIVANEGRLVTVPWQAAQFNFEQRTAVVNLAPDVYRTIPTYTVQQYPTFFAPAYRTEIYRYYGLTPGQERRLDRRLDRNGRPY